MKITSSLIPFSGQSLEEEQRYTEVLFKEKSLPSQTAKHLLFKNSSLVQTDLSNGIFQYLRIEECTFEGCNIANSDCNKGSVVASSLTNCRLTGIKLNEAVIKEVSFIECRADYSQFQSAQFKKVKFERCDLKGAYFEGADLTGAVFDNCDLREADFSSAKLKGADLRGSKVDGMRIDPHFVKDLIVDVPQALYIAQLLGVKIL
jgi:uncharacterized protein YjbI with pentapeptide repeats